MKYVNLSLTRIAFTAAAASIAVSGCSDSSAEIARQEAFKNDLNMAFALATPEIISALGKKYVFPQAPYIPECKKALNYDGAEKMIQNGYNHANAMSCLKVARVKDLLAHSETIEQALDRGFPPAVAVFIPECRKSFAAGTAYNALSLEQSKQVYICTLKKAETLNWERKWYTDNYNLLK